MTYRYLFFDVDDTLLDFQQTEKRSLQHLFAKQEIDFNQGTFQQYKQINHQLWQAYEKGEKSSQEVRESRFKLFFESLGKVVDGQVLEAEYREYLNQGHDLLGNSRQVLTKLAKTHELFVVTNGPTTTQQRRLKDAQIIHYFQEIFISEEVGYQKPQKEFFEKVFSQLPTVPKSQSLIIGDSLSADIQGGVNAGIDTAWLNPNQQAIAKELTPTFELSRLDDLLTIV